MPSNINKEETKLYSMAMMTTIEYGDFHITRVPGGWLFRSTQGHYTQGHYNHGTLANRSESMAFVPYSETRSTFVDR